MKWNHRKYLVLLACVMLLLTCAAGGTMAYLTDRTDAVVMAFTPAYLTSRVVEDFSEADGAMMQKDIRVQNDGSIDAYVRVAVYGNWVNEAGQIVAPWTGTVETASDWAQGPDGYYYYTARLAASVDGANSLTGNLLASPITQTGGPEGAHLVIHVIHQSIQADPVSAVTDAWHVTVGADGSISK